MKVLLLCNDNPNQRLLAQRLHGLHSLAAIGIVRIPAPVRRQSFGVRAARALVGLPLRRAWFGMMAECARKAPDFPDVPTATHDGVNNITLAEQVAALAPELVVVSGTDLLKAPLIERSAGPVGSLISIRGLVPTSRGPPTAQTGPSRWGNLTSSETPSCGSTRESTPARLSLPSELC